MSATENSGLPPHSDNADEELSRVRSAMDTVFSTSATPSSVNNGDLLQQRQFANQYLTSFQNTAISWVVCDRLLWEADPGMTVGSFISPATILKRQQGQFFAAQTLHTKCRIDRDVQQLLTQGQDPGNARPDYRNSPVLQSLRDSLLQHLHRSVSNTSNVPRNAALTTRLAMCVSALAVQIQWTTILTDLLTQTQASENPIPAESVLFILRALPEECASNRLLLLDDNDRYLMRDHLIDKSADVFGFLLHHMSSTAGDEHQQQYTLSVLQAWHHWIRYVPVRPHVIAESPLLPATVQTLIQAPQLLQHPRERVSYEIIEEAADAVVMVLRMYPSNGPPDNARLVQQMLQLLSNLPLTQVLEANNNPANGMDLENLVRDYCRVVTEMGESYLSWILNCSQQEQEAAFHLVDWVLLCASSISDSEVAGITLHFWYRMVMDLEETEPMQWRQELIDLYASRLLHFVSVCALNLMKFPEDISDLPEDQMDEVLRHRFHVSETVEDCCRLLGGSTVLQRIAELLHQQVQTPSGQNDWQSLESCLSCLVAIHMFVSDDENQVLPFCFEQLIPGLVSSQHQQPAPLCFTICKIIGKFASWLSYHARSKPNLMPPLLPFLAKCLQITDCAPAAAVAIKELCTNSHPQTFAIAQPVLELYEQVVAASIKNQHQDGSSLLLRDELELLEGVCVALSRHVELDPSSAPTTSSGFLQRLVQPIGNRLAEQVNSPTATPRTTLPDVQRLAVVVQHLKLAVSMDTGRPHPLVEMMQSLWSFLDSLIARFPNDAYTAEQICHLHKHSLRSCGAIAYVPMIGQLMKQLVEGYNSSHQSPFLYAASIVVAEYGGARNEAYPPSLQLDLFTMVSAMVVTTFSFINSVESCTNSPDVVEELFYFLDRMLNYCPDTFVPSDLLPQTVQAAVLCMNVDNPGCNKGTLKYLDGVLSHAINLSSDTSGPNADRDKQKASLEQVLSQQGGAIVENLVKALAGILPSYSPKISEILWKFNKLFRGNAALLNQWISSSLGQTELPDFTKNEFLGAMGTDLARDEFSMCVRNFQNQSVRHTQRYMHGEFRH